MQTKQPPTERKRRGGDGQNEAGPQQAQCTVACPPCQSDQSCRLSKTAQTSYNRQEQTKKARRCWHSTGGDPKDEASWMPHSLAHQNSSASLNNLVAGWRVLTSTRAIRPRLSPRGGENAFYRLADWQTIVTVDIHMETGRGSRSFFFSIRRQEGKRSRRDERALAFPFGRSKPTFNGVTIISNSRS